MEEINVNRIKKKLKSERGASVILALGLFLICTMISSIIVTAAASGSSRNVHDSSGEARRVEQQREYLAVSSAAQTVMKEMQKLEKYVGREITSEYICCDNLSNEQIEYLKEDGTAVTAVTFEGYVLQETYTLDGIGEVKAVMLKDGGFEGDGSGSETHIADGEPKVSVTKERYYNPQAMPNPILVAEQPEGTEEAVIEETKLEGALEQVIGTEIDQIYGRKAEELNSEAEIEFEIELPNQGEETKLPKVKGKLTMDKNYNIKIEIMKNQYVLVITSEANKREIVKEIADPMDPEFEYCTHKIRYKYLKDGRYLLGEQGDSDEGIKIPKAKTIKTTVITWEKPKLVKGTLEEVADGS